MRKIGTPALLIPLILLLVILLPSCTKDMPTAPTESAHVLFPLSTGAEWKYSVYYSYYNTLSPELVDYKNAFGYLRLKVLNVHNESEKGTQTFLLEKHCHIDSIINTGNWYDGTVVTKSYNSVDTTYSFNVVLQNDTLWYENSTGLEYMLPWSYVPSGNVNLKLFDFPGREYTDFPWFGGGQEQVDSLGRKIYQYQYKEYDWDGGALLTEYGGPQNVHLEKPPMGNMPNSEYLSYELIQYTPCVPSPQ